MRFVPLILLRLFVPLVVGIRIVQVSPDHPVVISKFMEDWEEIDADAVAYNGEMVSLPVGHRDPSLRPYANRSALTLGLLW